MITIVVPVYKEEEYLNRCVDSILNQTYTDFELLLVDDGSPDNSGNLCDELAEKHNKILVLHQENQGQAAARNNGVKTAHGEWLHFVDCDDSLHPQMLESLYNAVSEDNVKLAMCSAIQDKSLPDDFNCHKNVKFEIFVFRKKTSVKEIKNLLKELPKTDIEKIQIIT